MPDVPPRMPRWVKVLGLSVIALLVLGVIVILVSNGDHGPARHSASGIAQIATAGDVA